MISAASGLKSRMESLDMLANNVSNSGTAGFKSDREFYNLYVSQDALDGSDEWRPDPTTSPIVEKHWTDFGQGTLLSTGNPLDLAVAGKGFFVVDSDKGALYTRNGNFRMSPAGRIVTQDGLNVRVVRPDGQPATFDPQVPVTVDQAGQVYQNGQVTGSLVMAEMDDNSKLLKQGQTYFRLEGANPRLTASGEVHQGTLEASNVPVSEAAVRLVNVMRQFEMLQRAASIGGEMNRQSVEQVAKVS
jgi:flagellar basal-body rod protein FlgF